jgi:integrase
MAQIRTKERKNGAKSFEVRINRSGLDKPMSRSFKTLADARTYANHIEAKIDRGEQVSRKAESFTFSQACADFLKFYRPVGNKSPEITTGEIQLVQSVNETFKNIKDGMTVAQITNETLQNFIDGKLKTEISEQLGKKKEHPYYKGGKKDGKPRTYSAATVRKHYFQIKKILEWHSIREKYSLDANLFKRHQIPNAWSGKRNRRLESGELERLDAAAAGGYEHKDIWPHLVHFTLETCARSQEIMKAKWSDINTAGRAWNIPPENVKTSTYRQVPLSKKSLAILEKMEAFKKDDEPRIFWQWRDSATISKAFRRLAARAKVDDFRFHDLRHEAICRLYQNTRLTDIQVSLITGHTNLETLKGYSNLRGSFLADLMDGEGMKNS